ncbi:hypothetical protein ABD440_03785 [Chromobacterium piscinae]|uniref:hypothetical protein n=1 Tax=Chromobacterium piscinae TaxID=686831 RepID=UPI0031FDAE41
MQRPDIVVVGGRGAQFDAAAAHVVGERHAAGVEEGQEVVRLQRAAVQADRPIIGLVVVQLRDRAVHGDALGAADQRDVVVQRVDVDLIGRRLADADALSADVVGERQLALGEEGQEIVRRQVVAVQADRPVFRLILLQLFDDAVGGFDFLPGGNVHCDAVCHVGYSCVGLVNSRRREGVSRSWRVSVSG